MSETKSEALKRLRDQAQELATALFHTENAPCYGGHGEKSCTMAEEARPLTRQEKARGWTRRPFYAYDPAKMCENCAAHWHASMLYNTLHSRYCCQVRIEAEEARKCTQKV